MTREEAIKILSELPDRITAIQLPFDINYDYKGALTMAISALAGNEGDTVSRAAYEQIMWERDTAIQQLKDLGYGLGEKPKENKGEWILVVDKYFKDGTIEENHWECSKCGSGRSGWGEFKFCPDCGADMRKSKRKPKEEKGTE